MENTFFVYTNRNTILQIERFHICSWEFNNNTSLVEFGFEIAADSINQDELLIYLYIPWVKKGCETKDLYEPVGCN